MKLRDQVALVTGGAKGMGRAIVLRLAGEGADCVLAAREVAPLEQVAGEARELGRQALVVRTDVRDEASVRAMVDAALDGLGGRIDILVNCAGTTGPVETPVHEIKAEDFDEVLAVNLRGTFLPTKHVLPVMLRQRRGKVVNIAGTSGLRGYRNRVGYSSSKWAVRGMTRTLALELGPHDVTVNAVCPNVTNGERMDKIVSTKAERIGKTYDEVYADFASQTALGRFIDEVDIAEAVRFLVSDRARNITGHDIVVDAGWDV
jgi:3-oxoacyl-[acyl-carrier protein] reductase